MNVTLVKNAGPQAPDSRACMSLLYKVQHLKPPPPTTPHAAYEAYITTLKPIIIFYFTYPVPREEALGFLDESLILDLSRVEGLGGRSGLSIADIAPLLLLSTIHNTYT